MGTEQVNLSTEHQYWRAMRDFVEPAVRSIAEEHRQAEDGVIIENESMVLERHSPYYSFDARMPGVVSERWRFTYVLEADAELVRMEAMRHGHPHEEPLFVCERGVDDYSEETAAQDVQKALEWVVESSRGQTEK